jgi:hypothetical protein
MTVTLYRGPKCSNARACRAPVREYCESAKVQRTIQGKFHVSF